MNQSDINTNVSSPMAEEKKSELKLYSIFSLHKNHHNETKPDVLRKRKLPKKSFKAKCQSSAKLSQGKVSRNSIVKYLIANPITDTVCDQVDPNQSDLQTPPHAFR